MPRNFTCLPHVAGISSTIVGRETDLRCFESSSETNHTVCDLFSPNCHHFAVLRRHFRGRKLRDGRQVETVVARRQITQETDCVEKSKVVVQS